MAVPDRLGIPVSEPGGRLRLGDLRETLIRQEETIIFALIERAQFKQNLYIYEKDKVDNEHFKGSFCDYMLFEIENAYAKFRRYTSPDEHPFTSPSLLSSPVLPPVAYPATLVPNSVNHNARILSAYVADLVPMVCDVGDDNNYGSSAVADVAVLQALSKRVHYGKFVAEAKWQEDPEGYARLVGERDRQGIWMRLSDFGVEKVLLERVRAKAATYGKEIGGAGAGAAGEEEEGGRWKVDPGKIVNIYKDYIIPMTKDVEVEYLMQRVENS